jgi:predicted TIM-barrel fold metal-dependent hydrolase
MEVVDTQVHTWELEPTLPWNPIDYGGDIKPGGNTLMGVPYDRVLHALDAVGVDAAILYTTQSYRQPRPDGSWEYLNDYSEEAIAAHPGRFAAITHVDQRAPDIDEIVAAVRQRPATLAIRVLLVDNDVPELAAGGYDGLFAAAARHSTPVFMYISGHIPEAGRVARNHPELLLIIDHLGLKQGPLRPPDDPPFRTLPQLLELAALPNVAVKLSGLPTLARTPFPFPDLWPPIHQVIGAFGVDRVMWASDYTRCLPIATYAEDLHFLLHSDQLSPAEKEAVLGATARRLLRWPA